MRKTDKTVETKPRTAPTPARTMTYTGTSVGLSEVGSTKVLGPVTATFSEKKYYTSFQ